MAQAKKQLDNILDMISKVNNRIWETEREIVEFELPYSYVRLRYIAIDALLKQLNKHIIFAADYIVDNAITNKIVDPFETDFYRGFIFMFANCNDAFDIQKFQNYIFNKLNKN